MNSEEVFATLTKQWEPKIRRAFLDAIEEISNRTTLASVQRMIEAGQIEAAIRAVGIDALDFRVLSFNMMQTFSAGGEAFSLNVPKIREPFGNSLQFRFDLRNPGAEDWIKNKSLNLITEIVEDQKNTIRQHLTAGIEAGENPRDTARDLVGKINPKTGMREGGVLGLTSQQEQWQRNYSKELSSSSKSDLNNALQRGLRDKRYDGAIKKALETGESIPTATQEKMVQSYRNKSLKYRADTIARTEALAALNQSQQEAFEQAIRKGHIVRDQVRRFWITAGDERVRHLHRLMPGANPEGVGMDEPFVVPGGGFVMNPPFGPMCRCIVRMKIDRYRK